MGRLTAAALAARLCAAGGALASAEPPAEAPPFELPAATAAPHVDFSADHFDYVRSSSVVHLKGHVTLRESTWTIRSDELWLNLETRRAEAAGFLQMEDKTSLLFGDGGEFDFGAGTGSLVGASAGFAPWRIHSVAARVEPDRDLLFRKAWFTSCNMDPTPHYRFRAGAVRVRPKKWLYATHCVFYLEDVPLFYTPILWKSLRRRHVLSTRFNPGYDRRNGAFLKSTTLYHPFEPLYGRFFLDYYGAQGPGVGNELEYRRPGAADGALYGYRIRDRHSGQERWAVAGDHFQSFPSSVAFQLRLQAQSDADFNNHYLRTHALPVTPELVNGAALVRTTRLATTRLSYSRLDAEDPVRRSFVKRQESAPRLDFLTAPVNLPGMPFLNVFNAFADDGFDQGLAYYRRSLGAGWQATRAVPIVRGVSLTPVAGLSEKYESRGDQFLGQGSTRTVLDAATTRFSGGGTLRFATPWGDWDAGHNYARRLAPNSFSSDAAADDRGVEANLTFLEDFIRPSPRTLVRLGTGYDWRVFRDRSVGFRDRVRPFSGDWTFLPRPDLGFMIHDDYQLDQGNRAFAFQADWGTRGDRFLGFGVGQTRGNAGHYFVGEDFAWHPSSGAWKAGGALREDLRATARASLGGVLSRLNGLTLFEKELWLAKDWHDFVTRAQFRIRPGGVKEFQFKVELRLDKDRPLLSGADAPWRLWKAGEQGRR